MIKDKGFILFVVLIFLQIFSILSLYSLTAATTMLRITQDSVEENQHKSIVQQMLVKIENRVPMDQRCVLNIITVEELAKKPLEWWKQYACADVLNGFVYYYVLEILGNDTCAFIKKYDNNQVLIAKYYRITLFSTVDLFHLKQSTFVTSANRDEVCLRTEHLVQTGQQMQRELLRSS